MDTAALSNRLVDVGKTLVQLCELCRSYKSSHAHQQAMVEDHAHIKQQMKLWRAHASTLGKRIKDMRSFHSYA